MLLNSEFSYLIKGIKEKGKVISRLATSFFETQILFGEDSV